MKKFSVQLLFCALIMALASGAAPSQEKKSLKVLLIGKNPDHPHGTHMYLHTQRVLAKCLQKNGIQKTIVSNGWPENPESLKNVDTIVLYSTPGAEFLLDGPSAEQFEKMMKRGVGLVTIHWASSVFEKNLEKLGARWGRYLGGFWVSNYGLSTDRAHLKQLIPDHPICRGWKEYELRDEFYLKPVMKKARPLLQVKTKGESVVVGWAHERQDGGRAYGTTLGHFYSNFQINSFRRTIVNAILWTAKCSVPDQGANVDIDEDDLALPPKIKPVPANLRDQNLIAWCIVPFDSKNRSPAQRAEMIKRIGMNRVAYDWRQKHVAEFEQEILEYKKRGIEYFAFWAVHEKAFELFKKHKLHPQIWQIPASPPGNNQEEKVKAAAKQLLPLVKRTQEMDCKLGLYNHGGWSGEPENLIAICKYLRREHQAKHVGIVYNLHHGHDHLKGFGDRLRKMKPFLLCLNLNGMTEQGDKQGKKILPLGEGELDVQILKTIQESGYNGPIGVIGHTQDDVELRLRDNLDGLHWILPQLNGKPAGPRPKLRTYHRG